MSPTSTLGAGAEVAVDCLVVAGRATVDEAAVTGESAPVVREPRPGRDTVLAGSRILSGAVVVEPLERPVVVPERRAPLLPRWWPATALTAAIGAFLLVRPWSVSLARWALVPPYLTALALGVAAALEHAFWRRWRVVPLQRRALVRAAGCQALVVPTAAVREDGTLAAVEFWPLAGVGAEELAAVARQGSMEVEGGPGRSVVILAKHRGGYPPLVAREPLCGTPAEVARRVAERGGAWPEEAVALEAAIAGRGGQCLGVADGGRPLGVVELRQAGERPSLDEVGAQGIALSLVDDPAEVFKAAGTLRNRGLGVAITLEAGMAAPPPQVARFVLAGPGWAASRPTALDLDADPSKLPAIVVGARRVRRHILALVSLAALCDGARLGATLLPASTGWFWPPLGLGCGVVLVVDVLQRRGQVRHDGHGALHL